MSTWELCFLFSSVSVIWLQQLTTVSPMRATCMAEGRLWSIYKHDFSSSVGNTRPEICTLATTKHWRYVSTTSS
eukprot:m.46790 g.46790  ORF g.46790 m.46790 type:complete len:74 (-) comp10408_c0_seq1:2629-2850(-)